MTRPSANLRRMVTRRAKGRCEYCRASEAQTGQECVVDHVIPTSQGGTNELDNLCLSCGWCNSFKQTQTGGWDEVRHRGAGDNEYHHEFSRLPAGQSGRIGGCAHRGRRGVDRGHDDPWPVGAAFEPHRHHSTVACRNEAAVQDSRRRRRLCPWRSCRCSCRSPSRR